MAAVHSIPEMIHQALVTVIKYHRGDPTDRLPVFEAEAEGLECHIQTHSVLESDGVTWTRSVRLIFVKGSRRMDVGVFWGGEQQRLGVPRKLTKPLLPYARQRIYFFPDTMTPAAINGACASVCLYLVRDKLVSLEDTPTVWDFLLSYLGTFKGAKQVKEAAFLAHLIAHYQMPEDYRAWSKYLSKTSRGLAATEKTYERSYTIPDSSGKADHLMIPAVADDLGVKRRTLYHRAKQGTVRVEEVIANNRRYLTVPEIEIKRLSEKEQQKRLRKAIIEARAKKTGSTIASARRWVERQEKKGLGLKEIVEKIGRKWVEQAVRSLSEDREDT